MLLQKRIATHCALLWSSSTPPLLPLLHSHQHIENPSWYYVRWMNSRNLVDLLIVKPLHCYLPVCLMKIRHLADTPFPLKPRIIKIKLISKNNPLYLEHLLFILLIYVTISNSTTSNDFNIDFMSRWLNSKDL